MANERSKRRKGVILEDEFSARVPKSRKGSGQPPCSPIDNLVVSRSRGQLRDIREYMVPNGVVHTVKWTADGMISWLVSLDGEHFAGAESDPSDWSPDRAADEIAGVGTCILPCTYTRGFLKQWIANYGGCLEFDVVRHDANQPDSTLPQE
jgi:hypothetical protein